MFEMLIFKKHVKRCNSKRIRYSKQNSEWEGHFFMKKKIKNSFKSSTTFAKMKKHKEIQSTYCNVTKNFHYNSSMNLYDSLIMISCIF